MCAKPICRHCNRYPVNRPRGLCWTCYYTPGVKDLFPSTSKYAHRGYGLGGGSRPLADEPTDTVPGTPERIAVLAQRARCNQRLWHPLDALYAGDPRPLGKLGGRPCAVSQV